MTTAIVRITALLTFCFAAAACGTDVPTPTPDGVSVDSSNDGDISIEADDGSVKGQLGELPEGFPSDEVPLLNGEVQLGIALDSADEKGFSIVLTNIDGDHDAAVALLTAKGFTVEGTFGAGATQSSQLSSPAWDVMLTSSTAGAQSTLSYLVSANN